MADAQPRPPSWLGRQLASRPITANSAASGIIAVIAELLRHALTTGGSTPPDVTNVARQFAIGTAVISPIATIWHALVQIVFRRWKEGSLFTVLAKTAAEQATLAPVINAAFMTSQGLLEGRSLEEVRLELDAKFVEVMRGNVSFWVPVGLISYKFVSPRFRVLFGQLMSVIWTVYLISKTSKAAEHKPALDAVAAKVLPEVSVRDGLAAPSPPAPAERAPECVPEPRSPAPAPPPQPTPAAAPAEPPAQPEQPAPAPAEAAAAEAPPAEASPAEASPAEASPAAAPAAEAEAPAAEAAEAEAEAAVEAAEAAEEAAEEEYEVVRQPLSRPEPEQPAAPAQAAAAEAPPAEPPAAEPAAEAQAAEAAEEAPAEEAEGRPRHQGEWVVDRTEGNWDAFLAENGMGWIKRKVFAQAEYGKGRIRMVVEQDGDSFNITNIALKTTTMKFRVGGGQQEATTMEGAPVLLEPTWAEDGKVLACRNWSPSGEELAGRRQYLQGEELLVDLISPKGVLARRYYRRV